MAEAPRQYGTFEASELFCPRCRQSRPVRKHLLLVLPTGISTITAAPYAPPLSAQKWIPTVKISTRSSPASSPSPDAPKRVGYGRKRCNCRCACIYNASAAGVCWITCS